MGFDAGDFWTSIEVGKLAAEREAGRVEDLNTLRDREASDEEGRSATCCPGRDVRREDVPPGPLVVDTRADAAPSRPSDDPRHAPAAVLLIGRAQRFADPYPSPIGRRRTRSRPGSSTATHPSTRSFSRAFRLASSKATWRSGCRSAPRRKSTTEGRRSRRSEAACRSQYLPRPPLSSCAERANTSSSLAAPSP